MIKEILIALVAVVVVILIIAFAALRFLRADDSDIFDDLPDEPRKPGRAVADSGPMPAPVQRHRPMRPDPARDQQTRALPRAPERTSDERVPAGYRDRDSQPRPASPERRTPGNGQRAPVTASRGSRPARQPNPDTQATASWEAMSDVDYWTELAADKPLTAAAAGPAPTARRGPDGKPDRQPGGRAAPRGDQPTVLPVRQRTQARGPEPGQSIAALARLGAQTPAAAQPPATTQPTATGPRPAVRPEQARPDQTRTGPRPAIARAPQAPTGPPAAPVSYPGAQGRLPVPLDDDPLTSPSFPAINTADSRSYRARGPSSQHAGQQQPGRRDRNSGRFSQPAPISRPAQQFAAPAAPDRSASAPNGYPVQAAPSAPAANPYGSFVGTAQAGYAETATGHLEGFAYGNGYAAPGQPAVPEAGWYPADTGNGTSYYDPRYNDAANHTAGAGETSPSGTVAGAADPGYGGDGYASADYYGSYGGSAYQGGYPAPLAANGYTGGATRAASRIRQVTRQAGSSPVTTISAPSPRPTRPTATMAIRVTQATEATGARRRQPGGGTGPGLTTPRHRPPQCADPKSR